MSVLKRICAAPADLELRLVHADQLSDRGDPRGTFIAHQIQLVRTDSLDAAYAPLLASTRRLEARHALEWLGKDVPSVKPGSFSKVEVNATRNAVFENGFLARLAVTEDELADVWKALAAREPIAGVELLVDEGVDSAAFPEAAAFRFLKISPDSWFTSRSVGTVLAWGMPKLESLDLSGCDLGTTGARLLANLETDLAQTFTGWKAPPPFAKGQLKSLVLHGCSIGDEGAALLFDAESLSGLRTLVLSQCRLTRPATLKALKQSKTMAGLTRLSLSGNKELGGHFDELAGWKVLPKLEALALPQTVTVDDVRALFPKPSKALRELDVTSAKVLLVTPEVLLEVAESLTHLDLGVTSIGDEGFGALVPQFDHLLELRANGCSLSDAALEVLVTKGSTRLVTLDVSSNKLTDAGVKLLAGWKGLEHVTHLRLGNNRKVTAAGLKALIDAKPFEPAVLDVGKVSNAKLISQLAERFGKQTLITR